MTPAEAVRRGDWTVNGTVGFCMFGLPILCGLAAFVLGFSGLAAMTVAGAAFLPCWLLAWTAWSVLVPRWRVWAYERVDDLDELKRLGFERNLIWPDGHFFERTELRSKAQRHRIAEREEEWRRNRD